MYLDVYTYAVFMAIATYVTFVDAWRTAPFHREVGLLSFAESAGGELSLTKGPA